MTAPPPQDHPIEKPRVVRSKDELKRFACGVREIDKWAKDKAFKFHERGRSRVKVACPKGGTQSCAFYSLSLTMEVGQKLLHQDDRDVWHDRAPLIYIDYLAVSTPRQAAGIGSILLVDALKTAVQVQELVPLYGIGLLSLNNRTSSLYERYGFVRAPKESVATPLMILPIWTAIDLFSQHGTRHQ